jgi:hypothetical protein
MAMLAFGCGEFCKGDCDEECTYGYADPYYSGDGVYCESGDDWGWCSTQPCDDPYGDDPGDPPVEGGCPPCDCPECECDPEPEPACSQHSDCQPGTACVDGECLPICVEDGDCPEGQLCEDHLCVAGDGCVVTEDPQCTTDCDCDYAAGERCVDGQCQLI